MTTVTHPPAVAPRATPPGREAGFSLVEVAIAITVLVLGMLSLGLSMTMSYRLGRQSDERKIATQWASSQLEVIRAMKLSDYSTDPSLGGYLVPTSWSNYRSFGEQADTDGDGDEDIFVRYFYSTAKTVSNGTTTYDLQDTLLVGLNAPRGADNDDDGTADWKFASAQTTTDMPCGQVLFQDPSSNGLAEGEGYWVTVRACWYGINGDTNLDFHTFVTKK